MKTLTTGSPCAGQASRLWWPLLPLHHGFVLKFNYNWLTHVPRVCALYPETHTALPLSRSDSLIATFQRHVVHSCLGSLRSAETDVEWVCVRARACVCVCVALCVSVLSSAACFSAAVRESHCSAMKPQRPSTKWGRSMVIVVFFFSLLTLYSTFLTLCSYFELWTLLNQTPTSDFSV